MRRRVVVTGIGTFSLIRAMSTRNADPLTASRPFDRDRDGFVMGVSGRPGKTPAAGRR